MARKAVTRPVRGSHSGRPIMVLLDALGQRWTLRILWELTPGPLSFRDLRERCDQLSPTVLTGRLKLLREMALGEREEGAGYRLTPQGQELGARLLDLNHWAEHWARD